MSDIVSDAREWLDGYVGRESTHSEECHRWHDACLIARLVSECERLRLSANGDCPKPKNAAEEDKVFLQQNMTTLTPVERCVLREVRHGYADIDDVRCNEIAYVLDRLLTRLGGAANSTPDHRNVCGESRTGSDGDTAGEDAAKCTVKSEKLPERDRVANHPDNPDSSTLTEAVAWTIDLGEGNVYDIQNFQWEAEAIAAALLKNEGVIAKAVPLYRQPQPTLTDAEREAVEASMHGENDATVIATLRKLLDRTNLNQGT